MKWHWKYCLVWFKEFFKEHLTLSDHLEKKHEQTVRETFNNPDEEARKTSNSDAHQALMIQIESMNLEVQLQEDFNLPYVYMGLNVYTAGVSSA